MTAPRSLFLSSAVILITACSRPTNNAPLQAAAATTPLSSVSPPTSAPAAAPAPAPAPSTPPPPAPPSTTSETGVTCTLWNTCTERVVSSATEATTAMGSCKKLGGDPRDGQCEKENVAATCTLASQHTKLFIYRDENAEMMRGMLAGASANCERNQGIFVTTATTTPTTTPTSASPESPASPASPASSSTTTKPSPKKQSASPAKKRVVKKLASQEGVQRPQ